MQRKQGTPARNVDARAVCYASLLDLAPHHHARSCRGSRQYRCVREGWSTLPYITIFFRKVDVECRRGATT
eukprot:scaffold259558_cov32-Tisochrysis_lutea.AAC.2